MRFLLIVAAYAALTGSTLAGPPQDLVADDSIKIGIGQVRTLQFEKPFEELKIAVDGIVKITPLTDRTVSIEGLRPGEVLTIAYAPGGQELHRMNIRVEGRMVKIYGLDKGGGPYTSYYCSSNGCGRSDPEVTRGPSKP